MPEVKLDSTGDKSPIAVVAASAACVPVGVFRLIYILLLTFGLYEIGLTLSVATPLFIRTIPGEGNLLVGNVFYIGTLIAAGIFIFAVYLSFEAFEDRRGPFESATMPNKRIYRLIELSLRIALIALLTIKLWRPTNDVDATYFLAVIAICLFCWTVIVKAKYSAALTNFDILGTVGLVLFALLLSVFSSSAEVASEYGLGGFAIMILFSIMLFGLGVFLLKRIARTMLDELLKSVKRIWSQNIA